MEKKTNKKIYRRCNINNKTQKKANPHLAEQQRQQGGKIQSNRKFINAVVLRLRIGSPWRHLVPDYGKCGTLHQRFIRWHRKGMWKKLLEILKGNTKFEWL